MAPPLALARPAKPSGEFPATRRWRRLDGRTRPREGPLKLLQRQKFKRRPRSVRRSYRHGLKAGLRIDSRAARDIADDRILEQDPPARHAAVLRSNLAQTVVSDSIRCSISASSWKGDGVNRRRSVPRGTVG
ncbi:MAG: hypothetical protein FD124_1259 [Alphaproteobacteria bacterium]|nr:MAG: hypothetical protein FD160_2072 [Caulobacteraceae bacterium]TPW07304.1 MAG: hypothetical protein FD124_1259 [Alphaproteobacteria bacterium]